MELTNDTTVEELLLNGDWIEIDFVDIRAYKRQGYVEVNKWDNDFENKNEKRQYPLTKDGIKDALKFAVS